MEAVGLSAGVAGGASLGGCLGAVLALGRLARGEDPAEEELVVSSLMSTGGSLLGSASRVQGDGGHRERGGDSRGDKDIDVY